MNEKLVEEVVVLRRVGRHIEVDPEPKPPAPITFAGLTVPPLAPPSPRLPICALCRAPVRVLEVDREIFLGGGGIIFRVRCHGATLEHRITRDQLEDAIRSIDDDSPLRTLVPWALEWPSGRPWLGDGFGEPE